MDEMIPYSDGELPGVNLKSQVFQLPRQILVEHFCIQAHTARGIDIPCEHERLGFFICLSGEDRLTFKDTHEEVCIRKGGCGAYHEPQGLCGTAVYKPEEPFSMLSITMPPEIFKCAFSKGEEAYHRLFHDSHAFSERPYAFRFLPAHPMINTAVSQLLQPPVDPDLFSIYLEGKVLEIIALMLQAACVDDGCRDTGYALTSAETAKLYQIRAMLEEDLENPPSPMALAGFCGLGVDRMNRGFKALFGHTLARFLRERRMEKARELLSSGQCNVTDACLKVGYSNLSHFAKQYRHYFGHSPINDRKRFSQIL